jgi:predicted lipoprotein with Yx(FWY)xxD motif
MLRRIAIMTAVGLFAVACGGSAGSGSGSYTVPAAAPSASAPPPTAAPAPAPSAATGTVGAASTRLGQVLVDGRGLTVYLFEADKDGASVCYAGCAANWPPLLTDGMPVAGEGAVQSLLGTTTRRDGKLQVTYNGSPLYYFVADKKPGDLLGQGIDAFGGEWYVLSPAGTKIEQS